MARRWGQHDPCVLEAEEQPNAYGTSRSSQITLKERGKLVPGTGTSRCASHHMPFTTCPLPQAYVPPLWALGGLRLEPQQFVAHSWLLIQTQRSSHDVYMTFICARSTITYLNSTTPILVYKMNLMQTQRVCTSVCVHISLPPYIYKKITSERTKLPETHNPTKYISPPAHIFLPEEPLQIFPQP